MPRPPATTSWRLVVNRSRDDLRSVRSARGDFGGVSGFDRAEDRRIVSPPAPSGLGLLGAFSGRLERRFPSRLAERPGGRRGEPDGGVRRAFMRISLASISEGAMDATRSCAGSEKRHSPARYGATICACERAGSHRSIGTPGLPGLAVSPMLSPSVPFGHPPSR